MVTPSTSTAPIRASFAFTYPLFQDVFGNIPLRQSRPDSVFVLFCGVFSLENDIFIYYIAEILKSYKRKYKIAVNLLISHKTLSVISYKFSIWITSCERGFIFHH